MATTTKKSFKKSSFFLNCPVFTPTPPLLMARPLVEDFFLRLPICMHDYSISIFCFLQCSVQFSISFPEDFISLEQLQKCNLSETYKMRQFLSFNVYFRVYNIHYHISEMIPVALPQHRAVPVPSSKNSTQYSYNNIMYLLCPV